MAGIVRYNSQRDFDEDRNSTFLEFSTHCEIKCDWACALNSLGVSGSVLQSAMAHDEEDNGSDEESGENLNSASTDYDESRVLKFLALLRAQIVAEPQVPQVGMQLLLYPVLIESRLKPK